MLRDIVYDIPQFVTTLEIRIVLNWWSLRKTDDILDTLPWQVLCMWLTTPACRPRQLLVGFADIDGALSVDVTETIPSFLVNTLSQSNLSISFPSAGRLAINQS